MTSIDIDLRVGGNWRYVTVTNDGTEVALRGENVPCGPLVYTEV